MDLIHWRTGDYSVFGYSAWQLQMYVQELMVITQSYKTVEGVLTTKTLFSYAAHLSHKRNERGGDRFHMCEPSTNETGRSRRTVYYFT